MSNELSIININNNTNTIAFGRYLDFDILNTIIQVDNDTVIITPRFNTTGLQELKVYIIMHILLAL
jgi:hypothetical protein